MTISSPVMEFDHAEKGDALYCKYPQNIGVLITRLQIIFLLGQGVYARATSYNSVLCFYAAMELALALEKLVNEKLLSLHQVAVDNNDPEMSDFIEREYLVEQVLLSLNCSRLMRMEDFVQTFFCRQYAHLQSIHLICYGLTQDTLLNIPAEFLQWQFSQDFDDVIHEYIFVAHQLFRYSIFSFFRLVEFADCTSCVAEIYDLLLSGGSYQKDIRVCITAEESWQRTW